MMDVAWLRRKLAEGPVRLFVLRTVLAMGALAALAVLPHVIRMVRDSVTIDTDRLAVLDARPTKFGNFEIIFRPAQPELDAASGAIVSRTADGTVVTLVRHWPFSTRKILHLQLSDGVVYPVLRIGGAPFSDEPSPLDGQVILGSRVLWQGAASLPHAAAAR